MRCVADCLESGFCRDVPLRSFVAFGLRPSCLVVTSMSGFQVASLSHSSETAASSSSAIDDRSSAFGEAVGDRCCRSERAALRPAPPEDARLWLEPADPGVPSGARKVSAVAAMFRRPADPGVPSGARKVSAVAAMFRRPPALAPGPSVLSCGALRASAEADMPWRPGSRGSPPSAAAPRRQASPPPWPGSRGSEASDAEGRQPVPLGSFDDREEEAGLLSPGPPLRPGVLSGELVALGGIRLVTALSAGS
mmetsp:Transcript_40621/g.126615  ORF Transcript_40621/g.126615 Transcript_40621/m.126615 type:complete len:251 (-) Transcript_40621:1453-2205(-)